MGVRVNYLAQTTMNKICIVLEAKAAPVSVEEIHSFSRRNPRVQTFAYTLDPDPLGNGGKEKMA